MLYKRLHQGNLVNVDSKPQRSSGPVLDMLPAVQGSIVSKVNRTDIATLTTEFTYDHIYGLVEVHYNAILIDDRHGRNTPFGKHVYDIKD